MKIHNGPHRDHKHFCHLRTDNKNYNFNVSSFQN